jgi:hypothetical protein
MGHKTVSDVVASLNIFLFVYIQFGWGAHFNSVKIGFPHFLIFTLKKTHRVEHSQNSFLCLGNTNTYGWTLQPTKTIFCVFLFSSYVGFVPVSNLLDIYSSIWQGEFSSKFLFMTDTKSNLDGEFSEAPDLWQLNPILR